MKLADLYEYYSRHDLEYFPGDKELRYEAFSPFSTNLYKNMLIYQERYIALVEIQDFEVSPRGFFGTANPVAFFNRPDIPPHLQQRPTQPWHFGTTWDWMLLANNAICCPYVGFTLWPEYDMVKRAADYAESGDYATIVSELL